VAVTTSVKDPRSDFEINALGTLNILEAARAAARPPAIFFASTNKVYGGMEDVVVQEQPTRYAYRDMPAGVPESHLLDFHSPYGCSKGAADQYVRDYARIYGLKTVVFRQSCIYGPRQMGVEDQGWAAHFVIAAVMGRPITIYGDGKQVRDMLYIDDLVAAYLAALERIDAVAGRIYNIGGGPANALSVWAEFGPLLERLSGNSITVRRGDWRPGDQPVYISAIAKAQAELGWSPLLGVEAGIGRLVAWVRENQELFAR
jgi:CDP-paratose 2-epimerase